jgi:signal transduction histidine kinase/ActR/RegA family two-component response regulator
MSSCMGRSPEEMEGLTAGLAARHPDRHADETARPTATLAEVDIRHELATRPPRRPDGESLDRALAALAVQMTENPRSMLQKLVEAALDLCKADTAGISLLEGDVFRWESVAGAFASYRDGTMPRAASPCGVCIDENVTQLMHRPDRHFPALRAEPRFIEVLLIPFRAQGRPVGTVWIVSHTDQRNFDREDERVVLTLAQFASAGWQLWNAIEAAEEANHRKDEFVATVAHELRNPLAAICNAAQVLQEVDTAGHATAVQVVVRQSRHLARVAHDLFDLSRIGRDRLELQTRLVELQTVVAAAVETAQAQIGRRGHALSVELPGAPVWLMGDPDRLAQLVANLLDNAAKYTPVGGQIWVSARLDDDRIEISVRDTGIGIPAQELGNIFDLFTQLESSVGGLGLGLALVRDLAERHGGGVEATSEGPGMGSQFTVRLPGLPAPLTLPPPEVLKTARVPNPRRLLIVEDHPDAAESLALILRCDDHEVRIAHDGPAALQALKKFKPDVVLLDVGLPGMDGYEVARRMREEALESNLTIIALSGSGQAEDHSQSTQAGFDTHLVKPVHPNLLRSMLAAQTPILSSI